MEQENNVNVENPSTATPNTEVPATPETAEVQATPETTPTV